MAGQGYGASGVRAGAAGFVGWRKARGELSVKEVEGKSRAESVQTRRNRWKKGKQKALKQGAESAKAAQKHMGKERQSARRAQEVLWTRGDRR